MAVNETDIAAKLIERLLTDPTFRATFRRDPAAACREAGLDDLAEEMSLGAGKAMLTLDVRESKSSLAGVMMAAAMEGVGVYEFGEHLIPAIADIPSDVSDVLSKVNLPALPGLPDVPGRGALAAAPEPPPAPPVNGDGAAEAAAGSGGGGGGGAAAAAPAPPAPPAPPVEPDAPKGAAAAAEAKAEKPAAGEQAAEKIAAQDSPEAKQQEAIKESVEKIAEEDKDLPDASEFPSGAAPLHEAEGVVDKGAPPAPPADQAAAQPAAPAVQPTAPAPPVEPTGGGGGADAAAESLLSNKNLVLDADAQKDISDGVVDPRLLGVLGKLTENHKIELSVIKTGHPQFTTGGSVSNHFEGRGLDIARVDGQIVNAGSTAARELASEIAGLQGDLRPSEVGTPFSIGASGFFTDGDHQDHIHVAFDGAAPDGFKPQVSAAPAAPAAAPAAAAAATTPAAPAPAGNAAAAADAPPKVRTQTFKVVEAEASKERKGDTQVFDLVKPKPKTAEVAPQADASSAPGPNVDLSNVADAYPGDNASQEQIAAWMAHEAEKRNLPPQLPIMASLVESGMKNLHFGDADSVGFFQMRVGIWDSGPYKGFSDNPELQIKWFLDNAEQVKAQRIAAGKPIDDPNSFGEWIADVERPAEQFRGRYQLRLDEAQGLLSRLPQGGGGGGQVAAAAPVDVTNGSAPPAAVEQAGAPSAGGGNAADAGDALLSNKNLVLDADAQKDIRDGAVDPRLLSMLDKLTQKHKIELSVIKTGHPQFTTGGSVSNHFEGRGLDIARVDGQIVNAGSTAARELASEIADLQGDLRPTEVGTPFPIGASGFFTDGDHQDHIHVAFDGPPPAGFKADVAATAPAAAPPAATPAAVAEAAAGPKVKPGDTQTFNVVKADAATAPRKGDTFTFGSLAPQGQAATAPTAVGPPGTIVPADQVPAPVTGAAAATAAGGSPLGAAALQAAQGELGVHETGYNTGVDVDKFLAAAGVAPGNPWCASFVTWSLEQSGHKMDGGGWAAVQTWVRNAEAGNQGLQIVSADQARPGDIVAYDWGHDEDFGSDGHIGFLASNVNGGKFTAVEGNYQDSVLKVPRSVSDANVKFIRISGDAPAGAAKLAAAPTAPAVADPSASAAGAPPAAADPNAAPAAADSANAPAAAEAAASKRHDSQVFKIPEKAEAASERKSRATALFLKAIDPKQAQSAAAAPPAAPAPGALDPGVAADLSQVGDYPGDNASQAELAKWLASEAKKAGLPPELPVMASLVESGVKNLNFGDADSVGFFQMRVGIWNQGEYAGFPDDPNLQAKWFIDHALAVKEQAIARGDTDFGKDPSKFGDWIADVERPAEQFRGRYQLRLDEARGLLSS